MMPPLLESKFELLIIALGFFVGVVLFRAGAAQTIVAGLIDVRRAGLPGRYDRRSAVYRTLVFTSIALLVAEMISIVITVFSVERAFDAIGVVSRAVGTTDRIIHEVLTAEARLRVDRTRDLVTLVGSVLLVEFMVTNAAIIFKKPAWRASACGHRFEFTDGGERTAIALWERRRRHVAGCSPKVKSSQFAETSSAWRARWGDWARLVDRYGTESRLQRPTT